MNYALCRTNYCRGIAVGPLLGILVLGTVLGYVVSLVLRQWNIDPLQQPAKPPVEPEPKTEAPEQAPAGTFTSKEELKLRRMIVDVQKQRAALEQREKELAARAAQLDQDRTKLDELKAEMNKVEERVKSAAIQMDSDEQHNMKRLAKIWAQMETNEVASLIKGLDPEVVAKVIANMQERQAAPILGAIATLPNSERMASEVVERLKRIKQAETVKKEIP
ncbi:MAG: hypothetical protein ABSE73_02640 [Planctomycetota bacterium]